MLNWLRELLFTHSVANTILVLSLVAASGLALCGTACTVMAGVGEGKQVFTDKKCITCHSLGDQKGAAAQLGGPLDHAGSQRDTEWLKSYLADPKSKMPDAKMPKQQLTDKELDDLVAYLVTLQ